MVGRAKMSPSVASAGVFPSPSATSGRLGELQFRTTNMSEMPWKVASQEDANENFLCIHYMGKRANKYMDHQRSSARLLGPESCTSRSCYVPHSQTVVDKESAARMKAKASGPVTAPDAASSMLQSVYGSAFAPRTEDDMRSAKLRSAKPGGRTSPLATLDKLMETRSHAHESYARKARHPSEPWQAPTTLGPVACGPWQGEAACSIYQREFGAPTLQRPQSTPLLNSTGNSLVRGQTPEPGLLESPAATATRLERTRRAEGLKLRQVFREDAGEPSGAASAASGNRLWRATPTASGRASTAASQATASAAR